MAVGPNGTVQGWGDNHFGQLGSGDELRQRLLARSCGRPDQCHPGGRRCGPYCGPTRRPHRVELGGILHLIVPLPRQVLELPPWILQVAAGGNDSFAVSADQTAGSSLWAWGLNAEGRLGDQTTTARATPVELSLPDVYQIVATDGRTAVIRTKDGGTLWAWGENHAGELGIDSTPSSVTTPTEADGLTNVTFVSIGHDPLLQ